MNIVLASVIAVTLANSASPVYAVEDKPSSGPVMKQMVIDDAEGQPFNLPELGSVIAKQKDSLRVLFTAGPSQRTKAYHDVDLQTGDVIVMMNGKKMTTADALQKAYDSIAIGQNIKFGVSREGKLMLVSFAKADPKDLPQRKIMMMTNDGHGGPGEKQVFTTGKKIEFPDDIKDPEPTPGLGLFVGTKNEKVVVAVIMPFAEERGDLKGLKPYDEIISINGKPVTTPADFVGQYEALKTGDKIVIVAKRGSESHEIALTKPVDDGVHMIKKN